MPTQQIRNPEQIMGGAGASIEGDPNRVAVFDGSGNLNFLDELQYDYDNKVLIVGEDNPLGNTYGGMFHSAASGVSAGFIQYAIGMAATLAPYITFARARGDYDSPQAVAGGDTIGRVRARAFDGNQWEETRSELRFVAVGDHDVTNHGMEIELYVTLSGSTTMTKVMTITHEGNIEIGAGKTYNVNGVPVGGGGASAFLDLSDVPSDYTGHASKLVAVKGTEDGLEFIAQPTSFTQEEIEDFVGAMVDNGTQTGIAVGYDDGTGAINFVAEVTQAELDAVSTDISNHIADTSDAHDASAISIADAGTYFTGTDVEAALQELGASVGSSSGAVPHAPGGRLTLVSGTPVMTSTQSAKTSIYYTPYKGDLVPTYNGTIWTEHTFSELTLALDSDTGHTQYHISGGLFDLFVFKDGLSGPLRLASSPAWSSATSRGFSLAYKNGILVNAAIMQVRYGSSSSDLVSLGAERATYVGTFRASANGQTEWVYGALSAGGTAGSFLLWNCYNRIFVTTMVADNTNSWTYASNPPVWRAANGSNTMRVSFVSGLEEDGFTADYSGAASGSTGAGWGIGFDSTTTFSGTVAYTQIASIVIGTAAKDMKKALGFHYFQAIENNMNVGTATYYGDVGVTYFQSGFFFTGWF